jgi:hypothetical protein
MRSRVVTAALALTAVIGLSSTVSATGWNQTWTSDISYAFGGIYTRACEDLIDGSTSSTSAPTVTKTVSRFDKPNGNTVLTIALEGAIPQQLTTTDLLDCIWVDDDFDGRLDDNEHVMSFVRSDAPITGNSPARRIDFYALVLGVNGKQICNKAFGVDFPAMSSARAEAEASGGSLAAAPWMELQTPSVCSSLTPPPEIPEVPAAPLLLLTFAATIAGARSTRRRRELTSPV